jgi:hypothetical protein
MRRAEGEVRTSPQDDRTDRLLWLALLLGPAAALTNTIVGYTVAHWVCVVSHKRSDFLVCGVDLLVCVGAGLLALRLHRQFPEAEDSVPEVGRRKFMAKMAVMLASMSAVVVIAGTLVLFTLQPCD